MTDTQPGRPADIHEAMEHRLRRLVGACRPINNRAGYRASHTAASLEQIGDIAGDLPITTADAHEGYRRLSIRPIDRTGESGPVTGRRKTCGEIAALIVADSLARADAGDLSGGTPEPLAAVFDAVASAFAGSEDRRQAAMRETAIREATEPRPGGAKGPAAR